MKENIQKYAVIVAGGKGVRMKTALPKQFMLLKDKPVIYYAIHAFITTFPDIHIILVLPEDYLEFEKTLKDLFPKHSNIVIVRGGTTRFHSVQNGLKVITNEGIVFVHDAARPLINQDLILRCLDGTLKNGNAIPAIAVGDSIRNIQNDGNTIAINRSTLRIIQTPQTFKTSQILPAFNQVYSELFTDEATVVETNYNLIHLVEGDKKNIKITTPEDMIIAQCFLEN